MINVLVDLFSEIHLNFLKIIQQGYFCLNFVIVSFSRLVGICVGCGISGCCGTRAQNFFKRFSETTLHLGC
jgi:hypothetical protein